MINVYGTTFFLMFHPYQQWSALRRQEYEKQGLITKVDQKFHGIRKIIHAWALNQFLARFLYQTI